MSLPANPFAVAVFALAGLAGLATLAYGGVRLRKCYYILTTDPTDVISLPDGGLAEVEGTAEVHGRTLTSPFTGTECFAYEYEVEEERDGNNGTYWETIDSGRELVRFRVADGSASALVNPAGADLRLADEPSIRVRGGEKPPERVRRFIEGNDEVDSEERSIDLKVFEWNTGRDRRYTESRIDPGESVYVFGEAAYDADAGYGSGHVNTVLRYGDAAPMFLVSDSSERRAALRVLWTALLPTALGLALLGVVAVVAVGALA